MPVECYLQYLLKQSAQSIWQFTNTFENTLTIAITNKGKMIKQKIQIIQLKVQMSLEF